MTQLNNQNSNDNQVQNKEYPLGKPALIFACSTVVAVTLWISRSDQQVKLASAGENQASPVKSFQSTSSPSARTLLNQGKQMYVKQQYEKAISLFKQAAKTGRTLSPAEQKSLKSYYVASKNKLAYLEQVSKRNQNIVRAQDPESSDELSEKMTALEKLSPKEQAELLIEAARKDMKENKYGEARIKALKAKEMDVVWGLLDDQPYHVLADLERLTGTKMILAAKKTKSERSTQEDPFKIEAENSEVAQSGQTDARELLNQARIHLSKGEFEQARAKTLQAKKANTTYGPFDDRPELVLNDIEHMSKLKDDKRIQVVAKNQANDAESKAVAVALLKEAREFLKNGDIESARAKALAAHKLNVVYGIHEDRPELVINAINKSTLNTNPEVNNKKPVEKDDPFKIQDPISKDKPQFVDAGDDIVIPQESETLTPVKHETLKKTPLKIETADVDLETESAPELLQEENVQLKQIEELSVLTPEGKSADELFNHGLKSLRKGDRKEAYDSFLAAYNSGQQLDPYRKQQLQDFLRQLAPKVAQVKTDNNGIQQVNHQETEGAPLTASEQLSRPGSIDSIEREYKVRYERVRTEYLNAVFKAERLREKNPKKALEILDIAMDKVEKSDLDKESISPMMAQLARARSGVETYISQRQPIIDSQEHTKSIEEKIRQEQIFKVSVDMKIKELLDEYNELMKQRRFAEAELKAKEAKELDPENPVTTTMLYQSRFAYRNNKNEIMKEEAEIGFWEALHEVDQAKVAFHGEPMKYPDPKKWEDFRKREEKYGPDSRIETEKEKQIRNSLNQPISLHINEKPLEEVFQKIADQIGIDFHIDPVGFRDAQVSSESLASINVDGIQLKNALNLLLEDQGLGYMIKNEVLYITSDTRRQGELKAVPYQVADLVTPIPNFTNDSRALETPSLNPIGSQYSIPTSGGNRRAIGQGFAQVGSSLTGNSMMDANLSGGNSTLDFDNLTELIVTTIEPSSWEELGGAGAIMPNENTLSLVIRTTEEVHEQIRDLLKQLRRLQDLQITVEVRFVSVSDRFFERIGVDFDFNVQDNVDGDTNNFGPFGVPGTTTTNSSTGSQGSGAQTGTTGGTGGTGTGGTGTGGTGTGGTGTGGTGGTGTGGTTGGGLTLQTDPTLLTPALDKWKNTASIVGLSAPGTFTNDLDVGFRQGSFDIGVPDFGNFNPAAGMQVGMAILSDIEAFFFIQAAQGDERTNTLSAPKITLYNGETVQFTDTVNRPFVFSVTPIVGTGAVGFQPQIGNIPDGVTLSVTGIVSADRRYVRLTVTPQFTNVTDIFTFTFASGGGGATGQAGGGAGGGIQGGGAAGGVGGGAGGVGGGAGGVGGGAGGVGGGAGGVGGGAGGAAGGGAGGGGTNVNGNNNVVNQATTITLQQPVVELISLSTTVNVPDGGTVLLGGIKRLREGRNMAGVPILNKLPYISRLFSNTGVGRETESLMLMVTPRIIIPEEEEELLGIPSE